MRNLVENAVAYGHKADVRISDVGDGYDVLVEDEGPGIPENDRQRVFEPFVRLESSRCAATATGGTGLGLTLVKAIVEGHGGMVRLEPRAGRRSEGPAASAPHRRHRRVAAHVHNQACAYME